MARDPKPTYEDHADLIETAVTALAASDLGVGPDFHAHFMGYSQSAQNLRHAMQNYGLTCDDLDVAELTPQKSNLLFGPAAPDELFGVETVERLGHLEAARLRSYGVIGAGPHCRRVRKSIAPSGVVRAGDPVLFRLDHNRWLPVGDRHYRNGGRRTSQNFRTGEFRVYDDLVSAVGPIPEMAAAAEWGWRCCWSVLFGLPGAPSVSATTDPTGVLELLRMREKSAAGRRDALRHWVKEHWRQNRKDAAVEHRVREHLRGSCRCEWFGLTVVVSPSLIDLAKDEYHKTHGHSWRRKVVRGG